MKIEIIKNIQDGARFRLKGQILEVTPMKADDLISRKVAIVAGMKIETAEKKEKKETR